MSERDTLRATLPPDVHDDLERLYEGSTTEDPDPRDLVAELHRQGLLDASQLKAAVIALETHNRIRRVSQKPPTTSQPEILGQLGHGAMGEVLIAKDPGLNRVVAVKRILPEAAKNKSMMRRFYTEAQITAQLDHPGIVPIHGLVSDEDGGLAYAMKLVRGQTLEDFLDEAAEAPHKPQFGLTARLERYLHVCDAMAYAHDRGIVHRDLKPENIMVGAFGEVLVMDWGIAKILSGGEDLASEAEPTANPNPKATRVGQVMGTPRYMSPEQAEGANDVLDARSDQYALGLILQEVVTLEPAIDNGLELPAVLGWAQQARRRSMKGAPGELVAIVDKACSKRPKDRYADVAAFAEDVRRFLRDEAPIAAPDGLFGRLQRWIGRHRGTAMTLIVGLLGTVVIGGTGLVAFGTSAMAFQQYQAQKREDALTMVLYRAMDRAQDVDAAFAEIAALTTGVAYAASTSMDHPAPRLPYSVLRDDPPNREAAGRHGKASMEWASVGRAKTADDVGVDDLERLAGLGNRMTEAMVGTVRGGRHVSLDDRAKKIGADTPVVWARAGLASGALAQAPGTKGYRDDLGNFRKDAWYTASKDQRGPSWSRPTLDEGGLGQVIAVSVPWYDAKGALQGVASMDVSAAWLQKRIRGVKGATSYLVDSSGTVLLSTETDVTKAPSFAQLPHPQHIGQINFGTAGWHETPDGSLAVWSPLRSNGWTWVLVASSDLLQSRAGEAFEKN